MNEKILYRLKFNKQSRVRFIGHLDLLNVFNRAIKRAGLPISYSQGFNPHQQLFFALPLSLGFHSTGEYLDMAFNQEQDENTILHNLNETLPEGLRITYVRKMTPGEKKAAAVVRRAYYKVFLPVQIPQEITAEMILSKDSVPVIKKSKKGETAVNIRSEIFALSIEGNQVDMLLSAGSQQNLKPELVVGYLLSLWENTVKDYEISYERTEMYMEKASGFIPLWEKP